MNQLKLHGLRRHSILSTVESIDEEHYENPLEAMAAAAVKANYPEQHQDTTKSKEATSRPKSTESLWKRRHSIQAARKNSDWANMYLSTAATDNSMAAFLSLKGNGQVDAEYFYSFIPKAVANQDILYKELLAIYNALHYWGNRGLIKNCRVLMAVGNAEAANLMKSAHVMGKIGPQKILLLKEINEMSQRYDMEWRIAEIEADLTETIVHSLVRSENPENKERFHQLLSEQSRIKGEKYVAIERLFPPSFV